MQADTILENILKGDGPLDIGEMINSTLTKRDEYSYTLDEIDTIIGQLQERIEIAQRKNNDEFESIIDPKTVEELAKLCRDLSQTQLRVMQLQCDLTLTREQLNMVEAMAKNSTIIDRRELLLNEQQLRGSLQQMRYSPAKEFFTKFIDHLDETIRARRKHCPAQALNFKQYFDWTQNHHAILILKACGKARIDIEKLERLFQSDLRLESMSFVQQIDQMDLNNFIEFEDTYSIESQLEISSSLSGQRQNFGAFISDSEVISILSSKKAIEYTLLENCLRRIESVTIECCKLLVDLNMGYIEAHLTDGINIDKLNMNSDVVVSDQEEQTMLHYAFAPREYMTQIGQHLLTLRKKMEQYDVTGVEPLKLALNSLKDASNIAIDVSNYDTATEMVMRCVSSLCLRSVLGRTSASTLSKLTLNGRRQLAIEAMYLDNVLEDLGLLDSNEPNVEKFKSLLAAP